MAGSKVASRSEWVARVAEVIPENTHNERGKRSAAKAAMAAIEDHIQKDLKKGGVVRIFGLKLQVAKTPKRPARMGRNPRTGEPMQFAAKPAGKKVKARVLKGLKEAVL
jgi:nucleoid DNA-binding protein